MYIPLRHVVMGLQYVYNEIHFVHQASKKCDEAAIVLIFLL